MSERRTISRQKSFLQGRVYFNHGRTSVDCLVRDLSDVGARLKFPGSVATPEVVDLYIPNKDESYRARVQWRVADEMGVEFVQAEGAPSIAPDQSPKDLTLRVQKLEREFAVLQRKVNELQSAMRQIQGADS